RSASRPCPRRARARSAKVSSWRSAVRYPVIATPCVLLHFLDPDQERLELRRLRVGITDERRQRVRQIARLGEPGESPVNGDAHGVHGLAIDVQRPDALGHDRYGFDMAAVRADPYSIPRGHTEILRQSFAD